MKTYLGELKAYLRATDHTSSNIISRDVLATYGMWIDCLVPVEFCSHGCLPLLQYYFNVIYPVQLLEFFDINGEEASGHFIVFYPIRIFFSSNSV
jgi:hypothetical protein